MQITKLAAILATALAAAQPALSTIVVTQPVAATKGSGGKRLEIQWNDDNQAPKVDATNWGRINIFLATGSVNTQFKLAQLGSNISPKATDFTALIPASVGPNGKGYFLRFEGTVLDAKGIPPMAFSARFELDSMRGNFNSTIQQANQGATDIITAAGGGAAAGSAPTSSFPSLTTTRSTLPITTPTFTPASSSQTPKSAATPASAAQGLLAGAAAVLAAGAAALL